MQDPQGLKQFKTIGESSEIEIVIQKSRFIGRCFPVQSEQEAAELLACIRKQHWDANHNCYAYRIGTGGRLARSSDDGEPSGTAGMPILNVLNQNDVTDALCVVTRYFGGVLLGAGGLVRAYSGAAAKALEEARMITMIPALQYELTVSYSFWNQLEKMLHAFSTLDRIDFTEVVTATFWIPEKDSESLLLKIRDLSDGKALPKYLGTGMRPEFP